MFLKELPVKGISERFASGMIKEKEESPKEFFENKETSLIIKIGERVFHPMWGDGIIKGMKGSGDNTIAIIQFYSVGVKKVYVKYANLKRKI